MPNVQDNLLKICKLKEDMRDIDRKLRVAAHKSPNRAGSNMSSIVEKRPPWNHGGGLGVQGRYSRASSEPRQPTPVRTRSRNRNPLPGVSQAQHLNKQAPKNLVHKQTIDATDKTVVTVSVKKLQQGKRPLKSNPVLTGSDDQLVDQFATLGIASKNLAAPEVPRSASPHAWKNVLGKENIHLTVPDRAPMKRYLCVSKYILHRSLLYPR